jgi:hypothetical protein
MKRPANQALHNDPGRHVNGTKLVRNIVSLQRMAAAESPQNEP